MKITIASTSPAVPSGPTIGPSQVKPEKPATCSEVTTTGRETVPLGALRFSEIGLDVVDRLLQLLDRSALAGAAHVRDLRQDVDAIARQVVGQMVHLTRQTPAGEAEHR